MDEGLHRLFEAAARFPAPWLAHAAIYRGQPDAPALFLAEYARYLADLAGAGAFEELDACLAAVEAALTGADAALAAEVATYVVHPLGHMPGFRVRAAGRLGPATRARLAEPGP